MARYLIALLLLLSPAALLAADPETLQIPGEGELVVHRFEQMELREEDDGEVVIAYGNIYVTYVDFSLYADGIVYWPRRRRIYAEGHVRAQMPDRKLSADRAYFDLVQDFSLLDSALFRTYSPAGEFPVIIYGQTVRQTGPRSYQVRNGYMTTCPFGDPHYRLAVGSADAEIVEDDRVRWSAESFSFRLGRVPVLKFPRLSGETSVEGGYEGLPIRSLQVGNSTRFGTFVLTRWLFRFGDRLQIIPRLDYRHDRGPGGGFDLSYQSDDLYIDGINYYISDDGIDKDGTAPESRDRGRAKERLRRQIHPQWRLDAEVNYLSDANFLNEYYEDEFKEDKDPETYVQIRKFGDHHALTGLYRYRINDFQDQTEYMPSAGFHFIGRPLLGNRLYLTSTSELANLRRRSFDGGMTPTIDSLRAHNEAELSAPFSLGPLALRPYVRASATQYSDSPLDESQTRETAAYGATLSTRLGRSFGSGSLWHYVIPEVTFADNFQVSSPSSDIFQFDEIDTAAEGRFLDLRLRNVVYSRHNGVAREVLRCIVRVDYFPEPGDFGMERPWGNVRADLWYYPTNDLTIKGDWELNSHNGETEIAEGSVAFHPRERWNAEVGFRHIETVASALQTSAAYRFSPRYAMRVSAEYDFKANDPISTEITIIRSLHMWNLEFGVGRDSGEDETTFFINFYPLELISGRKTL